MVVILIDVLLGYVVLYGFYLSHACVLSHKIMYAAHGGGHVREWAHTKHTDIWVNPKHYTYLSTHPHKRPLPLTTHTYVLYNIIRTHPHRYDTEPEQTHARHTTNKEKHQQCLRDTRERPM